MGTGGAGRGGLAAGGPMREQQLDGANTQLKNTNFTSLLAAEKLAAQNSETEQGRRALMMLFDGAQQTIGTEGAARKLSDQYQKPINSAGRMIRAIKAAEAASGRGEVRRAMRLYGRARALGDIARDSIKRQIKIDTNRAEPSNVVRTLGSLKGGVSRLFRGGVLNAERVGQAIGRSQQLDEMLAARIARES